MDRWPLEDMETLLLGVVLWILFATIWRVLRVNGVFDEALGPMVTSGRVMGARYVGSLIGGFIGYVAGQRFLERGLYEDTSVFSFGAFMLLWLMSFYAGGFIAGDIARRLTEDAESEGG